MLFRSQGTMPGELRSPSHSPPQAPSPPEQGSGEETGSTDEEKSSDPVQEQPQQPGSTDDSSNSNEQVEAALTSLAKEGVVRYLNLLLAKADAPYSDVPDISKVREWSYKDLLRLPKSQQKEWMDACHQELDSLCKRDIYDLVNPPPGRRIIHNRWVFDKKTDGWKRARLVAKGLDRKSTRLNSSHRSLSRMPSSA